MATKIPDYFNKSKNVDSSRHKNKGTLCAEKDIKEDGNIYQEDSDEIIKNRYILHQFDLDYKYGPSQDITRLDRWERANNLQLNPPAIVKQIILSDPPKYSIPFWHDYPFLCPDAPSHS